MRAYMEALDVQLDIIRFWRGHYGPRVANYWVGMLADPTKDTGQTMSLGDPEVFAEREARGLDQAETYWVSPSMVELIDQQRHLLPSYELRSTDLPSREGFVFLAKPIYVRDRHGRLCNVRAFSWQFELVVMSDDPTSRPRPITEDEAAEAWALEDIIPVEDQVEEPDDADLSLTTPVIQRSDGSFVAKAVRFFVYSDGRDPWDQGWGDPDDPDIQRSVRDIRESLPSRWGLFHVETWLLNQQLPEPTAGEEYGNAEAFTRIAATFWTLANQRIVLTHGMGTDRATRKRAERAGFRRPDEIKVVVLRREYERETWERGEPGDEGRGYSHAFWVRGHLRNQWYPSEGRHKPKWIEAFVKGAGPVEEKDTINVLRR